MSKQNIALGIGVYLLCLGLCAFLAWMSGYNFDHRDPTVGEYTLYALTLSTFPACVAAMLAQNFTDDVKCQP